jgi:membrane fusion protein, macrolide-specific efflux system
MPGSEAVTSVAPAQPPVSVAPAAQTGSFRSSGAPHRADIGPPTRENAVAAPAKRRTAAWRLALAVALATVILAVGWSIKAKLFSSPAANLMTMVVTRGDIEQTVLASGTLKPEKLIAVGAQVSGRITSLRVKLGEKVKAGDLVAEIDSLTQQNSLRSALAALDNTRAQRQEKEATLALAESALLRQQSTFAQKASSRADFETAEANVKTTRAQIAQLDAQIIQAEVAVATARINLGYTHITAPVDGTVLSIVTQEGQTVNAVQSAPTIVILGQLDVMTILAEISEADVVKVRPGQNVYFTILGEPAHRYRAQLRSIEPAPESIKSDSSFTSSSTSATSSSSSSSSAIYYNGLFEVPNDDGYLRTYMTAEVHIVLGEARNVVTVPVAALRGPDAEGVYEARIREPSGAITTRSVKVGLNNKITAEILTGLKEGERVLIGSGNDAPAKAAAALPSGPF